MEFGQTEIYHMVLSAVIFVTLWKTVGEKLIKPFFELLEERESQTVGDEKKAKETLVRSVQVKADIESELQEATVEGIQLRDSQVERAKEEASKVLSEARAKSEATLQAGRDEIEKLVSGARGELDGQVEVLGQTIVSKVFDGGGLRH